MDKLRLRRKKSVNFKEEPEILQTPPKTATLNRKNELKSALKGGLTINVEQLSPQPRIEDHKGVSGSQTERFIQPAPLLPPFKTSGLKDTLHLPQK